MGPNLEPLEENVNYLRRVLEALAAKADIDLQTLNPPPPLQTKE